MIYNNGSFMAVKVKNLYTITCVDHYGRNIQWRYENGSPLGLYNKELVELRDFLDKIINENFAQKNPQIKFQKLNDDATIPTYADDSAEGMDLYSPLDLTIPAKGKVNIKLGIKAEIPSGYWLMFKSRSGSSWKAGIEHGAGVIDNNYRQELGLILYNHENTDYEIKKGMRIAQAIPMKSNRFDILESDVEDGSRGGFGSTGV